MSKSGMLNIRHVKSFCSARKGFFHQMPKSKYLLIEIFLKQKRFTFHLGKKDLFQFKTKKKVLYRSYRRGLPLGFSENLFLV